MAEQLSLVDEIRREQTTAAIATTYAISFPFLESVIHRRLSASGCKQLIVLVDGARCAEAYLHRELRPRLAGFEYVLLPVAMRGAFHPKILLLLSPRGGRLFLGSHNLTMSGYGTNAEVTSMVTVEGKDRAGVTLIRAALDAVRAWSLRVPDALAQVLDDAIRPLAWLRGPAAPSTDHLLWTGPGRPALWNQLLPLVRDTAEVVSIIAPTFDQDFAMIRRLLADLKPKRLIVGVDPDHVQIDPALARRLPARFVDVREIVAAASHENALLHAKLLHLRRAKRQTLVIGSANASAAAWLSADRNAEAVLARTDPASADLSLLGIEALADHPEITREQWREIGRRPPVAPPPAHDIVGPLVALARGAEIRVPVWSGSAPRSASVLLRDGRTLHDVPCSLESGDLIASGLPQDVDLASLVEFPATPAFAVVHHLSHLRPTGQAAIHRDVRLALASVEGDSSQAAKLLDLVSKAIFDTDPEALVGRGRRHKPSGPSAKDGEAKRITELSMHLREPATERATRRLPAAGGDIVALIDVLIRGLGVASDAQALDREDDVEGPVRPEPKAADETISNEKMVKVCRGKVAALVRRMTRRLEVVVDSGDGATSVLIQLAAVMAALQCLHRLERKLGWLHYEEPLLLTRPVEEFFFTASSLLARENDSPLVIARSEMGDGSPEQSLALALLAWLGMVLGLDATALREFPDEDERDDVHWVARLVWLMREAARDGQALADLQDALAWRDGRGTFGASSWLIAHARLGYAMLLAEHGGSELLIDQRQARRGDIVILTMPNGLRHVALVVEPRGEKLLVADPLREDGRPVLARFAAVVDAERTTAHLRVQANAAARVS